MSIYNVTCRLAFSADNYIDNSTIYPVGVADIDLLPIDNVKTENMWEFGQIQNTQYLDIDLGRFEVVSVLAAIKHTCSTNSLWRIRLANTRAQLDSSPTYNSDWVEMNPGMNNFGLLNWGEFDWGQFSFEHYAKGLNRISYHVMPSAVICRWIRIEFNDLNLDDVVTFLQFARLWAGSLYQPQHGAAYGSGIAVEDFTLQKKAESGVMHRSKRKTASRSLTAIIENEDKRTFLYNLFGKVLGYKGFQSPILAILEPLSEETLAFTSLYCTIEDRKVTATYAGFNRLGTTLQLVEDV